jgi:hypothetical protein
MGTFSVEGIEVGTVIVGVRDGVRSYYHVTKVNKKSLRIAHRGSSKDWRITSWRVDCLFSPTRYHVADLTEHSASTSQILPPKQFV